LKKGEGLGKIGLQRSNLGVSIISYLHKIISFFLFIQINISIS